MQKLKDLGVNAKLSMVGTGPELEALRARAREAGLSDLVAVEPSMPYEVLLDRMEQAQVLLFTSGYEEGWGAVLNDAMDAGCAVVASDAAGSTSYLIENGKNGYSYPTGEVDAAAELVEKLLSDDALRARIGANAYRTIAETWNCDAAAQRLLSLAEAIRAGEPTPDLYADGPCSLIKGPEQ